ncbi:metalloregulator ArsR/SmtB family transcription factor [Thiomicrorhabdus sp. 6S2-11]|uniref:Metalloregulator ArsR/SmtB family transcription factor n=1 Tax=Thiomicrorhabdus marina TaxID=2818442 RepID=A0ABS3Q1M2_9GAMM|nr:metalloregulator ArsR/SmtB family transcription factor [Thiomicrorhabdus marina]MBO1926176.1 metalloregulator ArsR/SmtB family transcription factor [Thiomicrorhabdus marina]
MSSTSLKKNLFEQLATIGKTLSHENRLMILDVLAQGKSDVDTLGEKVGLTRAGVSKHLQHLKHAGLVTSRREGKHIIYTLSDESVYTLIVHLRQVAETQLEEMQALLKQHLKPNTLLEPIPMTEIKKLEQNHQAYQLVDVRPEDEFLEGHIPNAINIPIDQFADNLAKLKHDQPIIIYCRGPYCMWSGDAVETLLAKGFQAKRLVDGYPEWRSLRDY